MVIRNFKYTAEDVDCQYCTEFRHGRCRAQKCPWLKERIEAGVLSYREAVNEAFADPSPLQTRIKIVLRHYERPSVLKKLRKFKEVAADIDTPKVRKKELDAR